MQTDGGGPIRLTNKTAIALRRAARQERTAALCTAAVLSLALAVVAVLLGIRWLPAVPLVTAAAVLLDALIFVRSRARYLSRCAQAICAEAAARELRAQKREKARREQAERDLSAALRDAAPREDKPEETAPEVSAAAQLPGDDVPLAPSSASAEEAPAPRRRRRQAALTVLRGEDARTTEG